MPRARSTTTTVTAYATAQTGADGRLAPGQASPDQVRAIFGDALSAEPPRPVTFVLYFVEATDQFTPESQALVDQVLVAIASRPAPELTVAGHTDAVGSDDHVVALEPEIVLQSQRQCLVVLDDQYSHSHGVTPRAGEW